MRGDEDTSPGKCLCWACGKREKLQELVALAGVSEVTSIHAPALGTFTVYLKQAGEMRPDGTEYRVSANGATEEAAIEAALARLGVKP